MRRILQDYLNFNVVQVLGMTDVDDKIIERSQTSNVSWEAWARQHEERFHENMAALGVLPPAAVSRVSEHIPDIVAFIQVSVTDLRNGSGWKTREGGSGGGERPLGEKGDCITTALTNDNLSLPPMLSVSRFPGDYGQRARIRGEWKCLFRHTGVCRIRKTVQPRKHTLSRGDGY